jgi:signal transduction histidine kinase
MDDYSKMSRAELVKRLRGLEGGAGRPGRADIAERRRLEEEIVVIAERVERRIGQDLHDGICQRLAGIELKCQSLAESLKSKAQAAQAEQIAGYVREVIVQIRSLAHGLAHGLSPVVVEGKGLVAALGELAGETEEMFNVKCSFQSEGGISIGGQTVATHLYRIAQEAVANAIKHGRASVIEIRLGGASDKTVLSISDNGGGFRFPGRAGAGMGLRTMEYRAGMIGAELAVEARREGGSRVVCSMKAET